MTIMKIVALVMISAGIFGLVYGQLIFTKESHEAKVGPIEISVKEKERVGIPTWASVGAIVLGVTLLILGSR
jgi:hypothetical protein